jgi:hypothetical protein
LPDPGEPTKRMISEGEGEIRGVVVGVKRGAGRAKSGEMGRER